MKEVYKPEDNKVIDDNYIVHEEDGTYKSVFELIQNLQNNKIQNNVVLSGIDMNDLINKRTGIYSVSNPTGNQPKPDHYYNHWSVIQIRWSNFCTQIALNLFVHTLPILYVRNYSGSTWSKWYSVNLS